jgi:hypothetical protein
MILVSTILKIIEEVAILKGCNLFFSALYTSKTCIKNCNNT